MVNWQPGMTLSYLEKLAIKAAMRFHQNNKTATANSLGICVRTLDNKLADYAEEEKKEKENNDRFKIDRATELERHRFGASTRKDTIDVPQYPGGPTEGRNVGAGEPIGQPAQGNGSGSGARVESPAQPSAQPSMPMPERKEVQGMPSKQATAVRNNGKR